MQAIYTFVHLCCLYIQASAPPSLPVEPLLSCSAPSWRQERDGGSEVRAMGGSDLPSLSATGLLRISSEAGLTSNLI